MHLHPAISIARFRLASANVVARMADTTAAPRTNPTRGEDAGAVMVLELADGTRLVPEGEGTPSRLEGDRDHVFTLAEVQRKAAGPFAGYVRRG